MKAVVAIDSMKGCLGSAEASEACAAGLREAWPDAEVIVVPVADGGEGTAAAIAFSDKSIIRKTDRVLGPDGTPTIAEWWLDAAKKTAYIDLAAAAGLTLVPQERRNPLTATTFGVGQLILAAASEGARHIVLGLGGSATVDGGAGACEALGVRFGVDHIDVSHIDNRLKDIDLHLACDVTAPFTGEKGAARVFGPQKGADPTQVKLLEERLERLRLLILRQFGIDLNEVPGSGAAGGCAGGLMALAGGKIENGAALVLDSIGFDRIIAGADLMVTGEGSADRQTLMGKLPSEILRRGQKAGIPVALAAGRITDAEALSEAGFAAIIDINSEANARRSGTEGQEAMDSGVATRRLRTSLWDYVQNGRS
ncbi:MAG: glycerate kinase [Bacteroidales bacterium]|nr:glycerate kinase [Bacteroidales bacterium]